MKAETWELVKSAFAAALDAPPEEREGIVAALCAGCSEAQREVQRMLAHADASLVDDQANPFATATPASGETEPARRIGRFEIVELIGRGGSGIVYRAIDSDSGEVVALKLLRLAIASEQTARRIEFEGELLQKLRHEAIARVVEVGSVETEFGRLPYIAMEYVKGEAIDVYAAKQELSDLACIELMARICETIGYAHRLGVIHRDLKPANILISAQGDPKILDFGIARDAACGLSATSLCTQAGDILGTPGYMSPEQCSGSAALANTRADVYALGVILFELLTRERLFDLEGLPIQAALSVIARAEPPLIRDRRPQLRGEVEAVLAKALDRHPRRRYDTATALAEDLRRVLDDRTVLAEPVSGGYMTRRFLRRHRHVLLVSLVVIAVLSSIVVWQWRTQSQAAARARVYSLAFVLHSEETLQVALSQNRLLQEALSQAKLSSSERFQIHDRVGGRLVARYDGDPVWLVTATTHQQRAWELAPAALGREHEQCLRALQVYCELLAMTDRSEAAEPLIRAELEFWEFTPESLSPRAGRLRNIRLLRLASTYGEVLSRLERHDEAVAFLHQVLAGQERLFARDPETHTDIIDTRGLITFAESRRAQAEAGE